MASTFLQAVAEHIRQNYEDRTDQLTVVLPGRRGALFLKKALGRAFGRTVWLPRIITSEQLIVEMSGLALIDEPLLMLHLYESYRKIYGADAEPFESFTRWGQMILSDFNEIDRFLVDGEALYQNLTDIREIEHWSLGAEALTATQQEYLRFMKTLGPIYREFTGYLRANGWAYQGLACRDAAAQCDASSFAGQHLLLCGLSALNGAEKSIFKTLHEAGIAKFIWDADRYYLDDTVHEAGMFIRENLRLFPEKDVQFIEDNFREPKNIRVIPVPGFTGQAQVAAQALLELGKDGEPLDNVAVVLANEKMLGPLMEILPAEIGDVNVTMEYPLRFSSSFRLVETILRIQYGYSRQERRKGIYYRELLDLLRLPLLGMYLSANGDRNGQKPLMNSVLKNNRSWIPSSALNEELSSHASLLRILRPSSAEELCDALTDMLETLTEKAALEMPESGFAASLRTSLLQIRGLLHRFPEVNDMAGLKHLFTHVVADQSVPFTGEPLKGVQVMGVLETRALDFENLILVNVNEGILPSGKSAGSFLPNDLKRAFGLPLYTEKDAVYAYHFYRLLQRAKNITIICNSQSDTFGKGEKSRFVTQLQMELPVYCPGSTISEMPGITPVTGILPHQISVSKTDEVMLPLAQRALGSGAFEGLSPSALIMFKECGLKFYFRYPAGIRETEDVEEYAEAGTFGTILHKVLEKTYEPFTGQSLTKGMLQEALKACRSHLDEAFEAFSGQQELTGKSVLQKDVIGVYAARQITSDLHLAEKLGAAAQPFKITSLEREYQSTIMVTVDDRPQPVFIRGKIDRIDQAATYTRVIDYKTSVRKSDKFNFDGFEPLFEDTNYNKQLQLIMYAWLLHRNKVCELSTLRPSIIPFKESRSEPVQIMNGNKPLVLDEAFLNEFAEHLARYIGRIFNRRAPFSQTEDEDVCKFCAYNVICARQTKQESL